MSEYDYGQTQKDPPPSYRINKKGKLVGPDDKDVAEFLGDTPIVISGGSLRIVSLAELDDEDNAGKRTKRLRAQDTAKHVSSVHLKGFKPEEGKPNHFVPSDPADCHIIIHYS